MHRWSRYAESCGRCLRQRGSQAAESFSVTVLTSTTITILPLSDRRPGRRTGPAACPTGGGFWYRRYRLLTAGSVVLRGEIGDQIALVVPGVRPEWAGADDQKRHDAGRGGCRGGRSFGYWPTITRSDDPVGAARRIVDELSKVTA